MGHMTHCGFAHPGTYGHECGAPATKVASEKSEKTRNGLFYARRCDKCAQIKGGENTGLRNWQAYRPEVHINQWA